MNQFQFHGSATARTAQRVGAEAFKEELGEGGSGKNMVSSGVSRYVGRENHGDVLSHELIAGVAVETVVANPLKALGEDVLDHPADETEDGEGFVLNGAGFMVSIPVLDCVSVVMLDTPDGDGRRNDVLRKIPSQTLSSWWDLALLEEGDEALWIGSPCPVNILFYGGIRDVFSQHGQKMVLPFFMEYLEWDVGDWPPLSLWCETASGDQDVEVRVIVAGSTGGLQDDDSADVEVYTGVGTEDILQTCVTRLNERAEERGVSIEPRVKKVRHGKDHVTIGYAGQESSADEVCPSVSIDFCAGQTEAGLAGKGNAASFSTGHAAVLHETHLFRVAAVQHLLDGLVIVRAVIAGIDGLEIIPMVFEDSFEGSFVDVSYDCSSPGTIIVV